jgi:hypothetical protein
MLIWRTLLSSTSTLTFSFFRPGTSALNTCASRVYFSSMCGHANATVSEEEVRDEATLGAEGKAIEGEVKG